MKGRIIKRGAWWYGEIYGNWKNNLFKTSYTGWNIVTINCYTVLGAKISLQNWIKQNYPKEFEIL